ncbi:MAG: hypothetical protein N3F03_08275 [Ignavibacteria bacterium]|nr:hypothetical protein [Ignavibacteria bacterium]
MKKFKVLIAEDTIEARDILIEELYKLKENSEYEFDIIECEFPEKAISKLSEANEKNDFYHILFIDIDFTQQSHKGGRRDSGFEIIKKAFSICPISKICTYSGQFKALDLSEEHQELVKKGLVVYTFDKSRKDAGLQDWFDIGIRKILEELEKEYYLFDIFKFNKKIKRKISNSKLPFEIQWEILDNINIILNLMLNLKNITSSYIYYRLIIHLYHSCLISFLRNSKSDEELKRDFEKNKYQAEKLILTSKEFVWQENNSLSIIIAESPLELVRFGFKLNNYRNKSIHPDQSFQPDLFNVIFSAIIFSLYVIQEKKDLEISLIEDYLSKVNYESKGIKDLSELLMFIKS